jgi:hypothetical protein
MRGRSGARAGISVCRTGCLTAHQVMSGELSCAAVTFDAIG